MAKVKETKQKLVDFMKAKGLNPDEIKEAFIELDAADVDLDKLADAVTKNEQWVTWYNQVVPTLQTTLQEHATLKAQMEKLKASGISWEQEPNKQTPQTAAQPTNFDAEAFKSQLTGATSSLMKSVAKYGLKHLKEFDEELDYDEVEKIIDEKKVPFDVAYGLYAEPKRQAKRDKEYQEKLQRGIQEGIQAELSKQGIRARRERKPEEEGPTIAETVKQDKSKDPTKDELRTAFLKDWDELGGGVAH